MAEKMKLTQSIVNNDEVNQSNTKETGNLATASPDNLELPDFVE